MLDAKALCGGLLFIASLLGTGVSERAQAVPALEKQTFSAAGQRGNDGARTTAEVQRIQKLIEAKQYNEAMIAVEALEKAQPKDALIANLKGAIYLGKNDVANARRYFERAFALDSKSLAAAMNLAQLDLQQGKVEAARKRFQAVLAKDKANAQAMLGLAGIAAATRRDAEYVTWLEKAAEADSTAVQPRLLLVNHYLQKRDVQRALEIAQRARAAHPNDVQLLDLLGTAQLAAGETKKAIVTYTELAKLDAQNPVAQYKLGTAHAALSDAAAARSALNKALALKPDYLDAEVLLASLELGERRYAEALKIAQQIQKKHPTSSAGPMLQGDILMAQQNYGSALKAYETASGIDKSGLLAARIHQALSASGKAQEADARLVQWLKEQPNDIPARVYLANTYIKGRQFKQAIEQYQTVLKADPKNVQALNDLAWLYQQEKDARALATAEQAYQLRPDHPEVMDTLGWILVEQGSTARGLQLLRKAAAQAPRSAAIRFHLAVALAKSGDKARARKELEDLLTTHKTFPQREEAQALLRQL